MNNIAQHDTLCQTERNRKLKYPSRDKGFFAKVSASNAALAAASRWSERKQKMADFIIKISTWAHGHEYSREYIAHNFGYTVRTVSRLIKELIQFGLIKSYNLFKRPNSYRLGMGALNSYLRQSLVHILPSLRLVLNIAFLLSQPVHAANVPLNKNESTKKISAQFKIKKYQPGEYNPFVRSQLEFIEAQFPVIVSSDNQCDMSHHTPKKGSSMSEALNHFRPVVGNLKSLELTDHGRAELEAYPDEAILAADARLVKSLKAGAAVPSPLGYLIVVAKAWCKERNIQPEYRKTGELIRELSIDPHSPKFTAIKIAEAEAVSPNTGVRADSKAWKAQLEKDAKPYRDEQAELNHLSREEKKDRIAPMLDNYKKLSPVLQKIIVSLHPFPDAQEIIDELLNPQEIFAPAIDPEVVEAITALAPELAKHTLDARGRMLAKYGYMHYAPLLEKLIAKLSPLTDETVWEEV